MLRPLERTIVLQFSTPVDSPLVKIRIFIYIVGETPIISDDISF